MTGGAWSVGYSTSCEGRSVLCLLDYSLNDNERTHLKLQTDSMAELKRRHSMPLASTNSNYQDSQLQLNERRQYSGNSKRKVRFKI